MDSKIGSQKQGLKVEIAGSRARQTPKTDFGTIVKTGLVKTANTAMAAGSLAAPYIPGGAVLSAAITGVGTLKSAAVGQTGTTQTFSGSSLGAGHATGGGGTLNTRGVGQIGAPGNESTSMLDQTRQMQEMNQKFNLQYLTLQQHMQSENRQFTTLSNVMKTKHDTAKNAISNVR